MDSEERARIERRNRMKEEKRKQLRRRKLIKKLLPYAVAALVILVLIIVGIVKFVGAVSSHVKDKKDNPPQQETVEVCNAAQYTRIPVVTPAPVVKVVANMMPVEVELPNMVSGYVMNSEGAKTNVSVEDVQSEYAVLINATSGNLVVNRNAYDRINPASMTKVMTLLVAVDHIDDLEAMVTVEQEDTDYAYVHDLSIAGFEVGETVTIKDLLYGAILPSGAECCSAIERYIAGSDEAFVQMMNDKASELGLNSTHFTNSAGLYNDNHYSSSYDIAMLMKAAIENDIARQVLYAHTYTATPTVQHPQGLEISNWFLRRIEDKYTATVVMGAKTGFVTQAGNCAVSYTIVNGNTFICTTAKAHSYWRALFDHVYLYNNETGQVVEETADMYTEDGSMENVE